ncbi:MAG: type 2 lantipeptide synthetase LanM, partial [Streptomycetaceae bacterium]|nr:type 2 lantipeptide synthetase LanM [Streptomycetaceae bacterium]
MAGAPDGLGTAAPYRLGSAAPDGLGLAAPDGLGLAAPDGLGSTTPGSPGADLAAWRHAYPDLTPDVLPLMAQGLGVSVEDIGAVVAADPAALAARMPMPAWAQAAESIVRAVADEPAAPVADADWRAGFTAVVEPFVGYAVARLQDAQPFRQATGIVDADQLLAVVRAQVTTRLVALAARTLVLELHVMRASGQLAGDDPEQRFRSFIEASRTRAAVAGFVDEYAPLARALVTTATQAADTVAEFLERLAADREVIVRDMFEGVDPGPVTDVHLGAGDPHDGGRAVMLLRFASGQRLVYKPRPMAVHAHFNDVLEWFGKRAPAAAVRRLRVVDRGAYGWLEFAAAAPCADTAAAERYFVRFGAQLALLYALAGTDFHYENIIAAGEHPVVVDVESLFHVGLPIVQGGAFADDDPATEALRASVAGVGLLPSVISGPAGGAIDIGGLGGDAGVLAPFESVGWEAPGTDRMRLIRVRRPSRAGQNKAVVEGKVAEPGAFAAQIRAGFELGYQTVVRHRDELVGVGGLLARFADDDTRVIVRATRVYSRLLDETTHPDVMRDALSRDRLLSVLWAMVADDPARCALAAHELRDMWDANVPLFRVRAGSCDVRSAGGVTVAGLLAESGLARAERVIGRMGAEDLARQDWIIQASLATRDRVRQGKARPARTSQPSNEDTAAEPRERALAAAKRIAAELEESAIRSPGRVSWFGLDLAADEQWLVSALKGDLFNGYSGIGLFF